MSIDLMHQSFPVVPMPPPPGQPRIICSRCQSRGGAVTNFIVARGLGISVPQGNPRAFDTFWKMDEFIGKDEAFVDEFIGKDEAFVKAKVSR